MLRTLLLTLNIEPTKAKFYWNVECVELRVLQNFSALFWLFECPKASQEFAKSYTTRACKLSLQEPDFQGLPQNFKG